MVAGRSRARTRSVDRTRRQLLAGTTLLIALLAVLAHLGEAFEETELAAIDARYDLRGGSGSPDDLVVVAIDDRTLAAIGQPWPLDAVIHTELLTALNAGDPRVVAYGIPFDRDAAGDPDLLEAMASSGNLVLGFTQVTDDGPLVFGGAEALGISGVRAGDATYDPDDDGSIRRFDQRVRGKTLPVVTAEIALGRDVDTSEFGDEGATIDFAGPAGSFEQISALSLLDGSVDPALLSDKVVVVGPTAAMVGDVSETPLDSRMPGVEVDANVVATILAGFPLQPVGPSGGAVIVAAVGLLSALGAIRLSAPAGILTSLGIGVAYLALAQLLFIDGTVVPVVAPMVALAVSAASIIAINYVFAGIERRRVRSVFGRFVPEQVVRDVVDSDLGDDGDLLRATSCDVTVLFSDIRGFTTYSEAREPEVVLEVLNDYLGAMTDVVIDEGGTLVNYMGDGIMAVFGAPEPDERHAESALRAARDMLVALEAFNERRDPTGDGSGFRIGIGLNSGPVVAGNVGTVRRLEYTMIGDTVNTAARIEGMTKTAPGDVLVAESTMTLLDTRPDDLVLHGTLEVRGRGGSVELWMLESN